MTELIKNYLEELPLTSSAAPTQQVIHTEINAVSSQTIHILTEIFPDAAEIRNSQY